MWIVKTWSSPLEVCRYSGGRDPFSLPACSLSLCYFMLSFLMLLCAVFLCVTFCSVTLHYAAQCLFTLSFHGDRWQLNHWADFPLIFQLKLYMLSPWNIGKCAGFVLRELQFPGSKVFNVYNVYYTWSKIDPIRATFCFGECPPFGKRTNRSSL